MTITNNLNFDLLKKSFLANEALLIDFDNTIVDYNKNEQQALENLLDSFDVSQNKYSEIIAYYKEINNYYWSEFEQKTFSISEVQRKRFEDLQVKYPELNESADQLNKKYLDFFISSTKVDETTIEMLKFLKDKMGIILVLITNGIHWVQTERLQNCGLIDIFHTYFTSESVGFAKPHPKMFEESITFINNFNGGRINPDDIWVIGDNLNADIVGAKKMNLKACWITSKEKKIDLDKEFQPDIIANSFLEFIDYYLEIKDKT